MEKELTILLKSGPMMSMEPNTAIKLANAALDKGYGVNIFGYSEGVLSIKKGQAPKRFPNVGTDLIELVRKGAKLAICETCSTSRGLHKGEEIAGSKIGRLTGEFVDFFDHSVRLVTLGR